MPKRGFFGEPKKRYHCKDCNFRFESVGNACICPKCGKNLCGCSQCNEPAKTCKFLGFCKIEQQIALAELFS